jgi:fucose permease
VWQIQTAVGGKGRAVLLSGVSSNLLVMPIVGGAIVTVALGASAHRVGRQPALLLPAVGSIHIVSYGLPAVPTSSAIRCLSSPPTTFVSGCNSHGAL